MRKITTAVHPGEVLWDEMNARGWKKMAFAKQLKITNSYFSDIIHGKRAMTELVASKLEQHLGIPVHHWMQLQANYDYCHREKQALPVLPVKRGTGNSCPPDDLTNKKELYT